MEDHLPAGTWLRSLGAHLNVAAGDYSFAAGRRAKINGAHDGAFLFADQNNYDFNSTAVNEFAVRATGGARFVTAIDGSGNPTKTTVITSAGNVGIGTNAPSQKLHVNGGIARVEHSAPSGFDIRNTGATFDCSISVGTAGNANYYANWNCAASTQSDPWKPTWSVRIRVDLDEVDFVRVAPGGAPITTPFKFTSAGELLPGTNNTGSIGKEGMKWSLVRATTITSGDLTFENGYCVTEDEESGLLFLNQKGERIAKLDEQGNLRIRGDIIKDPTL